MQPIPRYQIEQAVTAVAEAWNGGALDPLLADSFANKSRLLDTIAEVVPRDARLTVLGIQAVSTLEQYRQEDMVISNVSAVVRSQIEFNDPMTGFQRLEGTGEWYFQVEEGVSSEHDQKVQVWDKDMITDDRLGEVETDEEHFLSKGDQTTGPPATLSATISPSSGAGGVAPSAAALATVPEIHITRFNVHRAGDDFMRAVMPGTLPGPLVVDLGDDLVAEWTVEVCHAATSRCELSGVGEVNLGDPENIGGGCFRMSNQRGFSARETGDITLNVTTLPTGVSTVSKSIEIISPHLSVVTPIVDQASMNVQFIVTNDGEAAYRTSPFQIAYEIFDAHDRLLLNGTLITEAKGIVPGGVVVLHDVVLPDRTRALATNNIRIRVQITPVYRVPLEGTGWQTFTHAWVPETYSLSSSSVDLGITIEAQLNNIRPDASDGTHTSPYLADDSWVRVIDVDEVPHEVLFSPPHIRLDPGYYFYLNGIDSLRSEEGIDEGKLMLQVDFAVWGSEHDRDLKGWLHQADGSWSDNLAPDIDLNELEIILYLTPIALNGRVSYSTIDTEATIEVSGWAGGWHGTGAFLSAFGVHGETEKIATRQIQAHLRAIMDSDVVRRRVEEAIITNMASLGIENVRVTNVTGAANSLQIEYLR